MPLEVTHFGEGGAPRLVVVDQATMNPLASDPHQTWAFQRAEITGFVDSPFRLPSGNQMAFARVRQLDPRVIGAERLVAMTTEVMASLGHGIAHISTHASVGVVLCLPERAAQGTGDERGRYLRRRLESTVIGPLAERGHQVMARTLADGHATLGYALAEAGPMLGAGQLDVLILLGVDSYYDPYVLEDLFEEERVLDSDWREGFVPGEAASALVLMRGRDARELGLPQLARIESVATNEEVATRDNDVGLVGLGLSRPTVALAKRLRREGRVLDWWISDATGEPLRTQELQLAWPRAAHLCMTTEGKIDLLPTHFGDLGAATMTTAGVLAIEGLRRGAPRGTTAMITGSSNGGKRSAMLLTTHPPS